MQASSHSESTSTLQFGSRVSDITLGAARRNVESGMMLDAREASAKLQREAAVARSQAAAAQEALEQERAEADQLRSANELMQQELSRLRVQTSASCSPLPHTLPLVSMVAAKSKGGRTPPARSLDCPPFL